MLIWCNDIGRRVFLAKVEQVVHDDDNDDDDDDDDDGDDDDDDEDDDLYFRRVIFFFLSWMEFIPGRGISFFARWCLGNRHLTGYYEMK